MSRIGKQPLNIPSGVTVEVKDNVVVVRGSSGELQHTLPEDVTVSVDDNQVVVKRANDSKHARSQHGLTRSILSNMVHGVSEGFIKVLEYHGVGYRASMVGATLKLGVGLSHDVDFEVPQGVQVAVNGNEITVTGMDKQQVGQVAAEIRAIKKPEPYKAKGIRYKGEYIARKAGKTAA